MLASSETYLISPYNYIIKKPGKKLRRGLIFFMNSWLQVDGPTLEQIIDIIEMLHNASLMIDDIEDASAFRRGMPVAHNVFGTARTINAANYMYFHALSTCLKLGKPEAVEVFTENVLELHRGQGKELYWRDCFICPKEKEYEEMAQQKTGGLFFLAVRLMELFGKAKPDLDNFIKDLSLYYQIRDDYLNLCDENYNKNNTFAGDITEGKFSFPIIAAIRDRGKDDEIVNILRKRTENIELKRYCIQIMAERGALRYTLERLQALHYSLISEIDKLGGNQQLRSLIEALHSDIWKIYAPLEVYQQ